MKYLLFILSLAGCSTANDIEGTYACSYEHEFAIIEDTLVLRKDEMLYEIERRMGVVKKLNAKVLKKVKTEHWVLEYNPDKSTLFELKKGRLLLVQGRSLKFGKHQYRRI